MAMFFNEAAMWPGGSPRPSVAARLALVGCREENSDRHGKILCKGLVYGDYQSFFSIIFYDIL